MNMIVRIVFLCLFLGGCSSGSTWKSIQQVNRKMELERKDNSEYLNNDRKIEKKPYRTSEGIDFNSVGGGDDYDDLDNSNSGFREEKDVINDSAIFGFEDDSLNYFSDPKVRRFYDQGKLSFKSGSYNTAKLFFENVLNLEPGHKGASEYLRVILDGQLHMRTKKNYGHDSGFDGSPRDNRSWERRDAFGESSYEYNQRALDESLDFSK